MPVHLIIHFFVHEPSPEYSLDGIKPLRILTSANVRLSKTSPLTPLSEEFAKVYARLSILPNKFIVLRQKTDILLP